MKVVNKLDFTFSTSELIRYSRHFSLPEVGVTGQKKLKAARVLCIGAGGLGSPLLIYLAASGIGTIGIVDADLVDLSNLQRQLLYTTNDLKKPKAATAKDKLLQINPELIVKNYNIYLKKDNAFDLIKDYDIVVDGTDNFATRYLVNDVCFYLKKPNVYASIFQFEGQCSVFNFQEGPCYRCLYPEPPPQGLIPNCAEGGILGVIAGIMGSIQANEVIKLILNIGESLAGRLLTVDALSMRFKEYQIHKHFDCCLCIKNKDFDSFHDYDLSSCELPPNLHKNEISVSKLQELKNQNEDFILLDVREQYEYDICNLGGQLIPLTILEKQLGALDRNKNYIVYCKTGIRSKQAVNFMVLHGFTSVKNLAGGIKAWAQEIDPTILMY